MTLEELNIRMRQYQSVLDRMEEVDTCCRNLFDTYTPDIERAKYWLKFRTAMVSLRGATAQLSDLPDIECELLEMAQLNARIKELMALCRAKS